MFREIFAGQVMAGRIESSTVTDEAQVAVFPAMSVNASEIEFKPVLEQVKLLADKFWETILQLSVLPLFTCAETMLTVPNAPK